MKSWVSEGAREPKKEFREVRNPRNRQRFFCEQRDFGRHCCSATRPRIHFSLVDAILPMKQFRESVISVLKRRFLRCGSLFFPLPFSNHLFIIETVQSLFNPLNSTVVPTFRISQFQGNKVSLPSKGRVHGGRCIRMPGGLTKVPFTYFVSMQCRGG